MSKTPKEMSLWEHVGELRGRLLKAVLAFAVCVIISFTISEYIIKYILAAPIGGIANLESIDVTENISVYMRVSLLTGFIFGFPAILWQLLGFITPGLMPNEKKWIYRAIFPATILFIAGVLFTYFVMLPVAIPFLIDFMGIKTTPRLNNYIDFITSLMFWVGIAFEAPLVLYILAKLGLVTARGLAKQWRIAIVIIAILAAVITPTGDPINMTILMIPLLILYLFSIFLAYLAGKPKKDETALVVKPKRRFFFFRRKPKKEKTAADLALKPRRRFSFLRRKPKPGKE
jgi:sec-independent protein translocase protein TatC